MTEQLSAGFPNCVYQKAPTPDEQVNFMVCIAILLLVYR
jgi:hypothetical protein